MAIYILTGLLLVLLAAGGYGVCRARRILEAVSIAAFGQKSFQQGLGHQEAILENTPRSVAAMTKVYLPQIEKDFPEFNWPEFRQKADNMLKNMLFALDSQNLSCLQAPSQELKRQVELEIEEQKRSDRRDFFSAVRIHQTEIARYVKRDGQCIITLQTAAEYEHRTETPGDTEQNDTAQSKREQTKYETELVYIQDPDKMTDKQTAMAVTCPQCGAPVTRLGSKFCEYCGAAISVVNIHVWSIHKIKQII